MEELYPAILVNYCYDPVWLQNYPFSSVTIYDRSDDGVQRDLTQYGAVYKTKNLGDVDYDKLGWLIENYDNLPEVFLWSKTNLFKFITEEEWQKVAQNKHFTPLLTKNHKTYSDQFGVVAKYIGEIYAERNDSWYFNAGLDRSGRFNSWADWSKEFGLPNEAFIRFAPGGSYILTADRVRRYSKDFYERMRDTLGYAMHPVEAHLCERSYFYLWQ